jgi:hypothetical protein
MKRKNDEKKKWYELVLFVLVIMINKFRNEFLR